ncbi:MAG: GerMN domain-containing protein [bacterium]|nr:GerMN domain-containing protein [bacterium]
MRTSKTKRIMGYLFAILATALLAGCQVGGGQAEHEESEGYLYQIYYLNSSGTGLVTADYWTETTEDDALIYELMHEFQNVPKEMESQLALPEKVEYQGYRLEQSILYLYFDSNYANMEAGREILCREALARTLMQLPFVEHLMIYTGEQPLMDQNGNPVGMFSDTDFISSITDVNDYEKRTIVLYFTNEDGTVLLPEEREIIHNINTSMERLAVTELLKGPNEAGHYSVLPSDVKILSVSVNDTICYLNFDESFLKTSLDVKPEVSVYALVNTISELSSANKIQITINGATDAVFRETLPLNTIFERNLDLIGGMED